MVANALLNDLARTEPPVVADHPSIAILQSASGRPSVEDTADVPPDSSGAVRATLALFHTMSPIKADVSGTTQ